MKEKNRVVVTGIGIATPLGNNKDLVWEAILNNKNGIKRIPEEYSKLNQYGVYAAGIVPEVSFDNCDLISDRNRIRLQQMDKYMRMLMFCTISALNDAKCANRNDMGVILGCGVNYLDKYKNIAVEDRKPTWFFETYPNLLLGQLSNMLSLHGYGSVIMNACCGGMQAIGEAYKKISYGEHSILLAGGVDDKLNETCSEGFRRLGMLTNCKDSDSTMRPFDKNRDGFAMGQGACILVLENLEQAKKRNTHIYGEIVGYGTAMDSTSIADASAFGKVKAMRNALQDANLEYTNIQYINAHGTATKSNDKEESKAITEVFQDKAHDIPISSSKAFFGHTFAACGALQSFICLQSLANQKIHSNLNFEEGDSAYDLNYVKGNYIDARLEYCISNTSAIGGFNTTLVFRNYKD